MKKIGTHDGKFHADEVFAVSILKYLYPNAEVIRTRNSDLLSSCDIVVDVGGGEYDHHTLDKIYRENGIPYASAGLVWRAFGEKVGEKFHALDTNAFVEKVDEKLLQGIDAADNGFYLEKDEKIKDVSSLISSFNAPWNARENEDTCFFKAVKFATDILLNQFQSIISKESAKSVVKTAFEQREKKEVLFLSVSCPWSETLLELDENEEVLFVIFPDNNEGYLLQVVPKETGNFLARKNLPKKWAGLRDEKLSDLVGINDAVFCHPARFIGGAKSLNSIKKMAEIALLTTEE